MRVHRTERIGCSHEAPSAASPYESRMDTLGRPIVHDDAAHHRAYSLNPMRWELQIMPMLPPTQQLICFVTVAVVGLLAGSMLGIALTQQTAQLLSAECWTPRQNDADRLFRKFMPPAFILTLLSSFAALAVLHSAARIWMGLSCFASLLVIAITIALEVPLNNKFEKWEPGKIPEDWQPMRDAWLRNHWLRTVCGIAAFLFALAACWSR